MKFTTCHSSKNPQNQKNLIFLLDQVELDAKTTPQTPLLTGSQTEGSILTETPKKTAKQIKHTVEQTAESAQSIALSEKGKVSRFTPENFVGAWNPEKMFFNLAMWGQSIANPKQIAIEQMKEAIRNIGSPSKLLSGSPLLSDKIEVGLLDKSVPQTLNLMETSGVGDLRKISLTSIEYMEAAMEQRHKISMKYLGEQEEEFLKKADSEVWWKKMARFVAGGQKQRYSLLLKLYKRNERVGHAENMGILQGMKQKKEQEIFRTEQTIDRAFITAENAGETEKLNFLRKTIHRILHDPEQFLQNPRSVEREIPLRELFGVRFNPLDVLGYLKRKNHLEGAITTNHWQVSHYNALRTIRGIQNRKKAIDKFEGTNLSTLETHVNQRYEPSGKNIDLDNPEDLVNRTRHALGGATPGLRKDLQAVISGDVYMGATEQLWILADYFGKNTAVFDRLPRDIQGDFAEFFTKKRSQIEKSVISGGREERGTVLWRAKAMKQGLAVLEKIKEVSSSIPNLGTQLLSREENVANKSLQDMKSLLDSYDFFLSILGVEGGSPADIHAQKDSLFSQIPELERGLLENVFSMSKFVETIRESHAKLSEQRAEIVKLMNLASDEEIAELKKKLEMAQENFSKKADEKGLGLDGAKSILDFGGGEGITGAGDIETPLTTLQRNFKELWKQLYGEGSEDGGLLGRVGAIKNFQFALPGNIEGNLSEIGDMTAKLLKERLRELGVHNSDDLHRPTFDLLARLDMNHLATRDILKVANTLLGNETAQQFANMKKAKYNSLRCIEYAESKYHPTLTVESVSKPKTLLDAIYIKEDENGAMWYHTKTHVIKITPPHLNSGGDDRNMVIWEKQPHEYGYKLFNVTPSQPHTLGIFLTANPENEAAKNNPLYGLLAKSIDNTTIH